MKMVHPIGNNKICPIDNNRTHDGRKSQNIPLPESHVHRTQSEVQLCQDMESAEQRDLNMFYRLVNGIRDRQMHLVRDNESSNAAAAYYDPAHGLTEAEQSLARIIHTRNAPVATVPSPKNININNNNNNNRYNHANRHSSGLNTGIPIFEVKNEEQQQQPQEGPASAALASLVGNHRLQQNEWSFSGFDDSSTSLSPEQRESQYIHQQQQQQQHNQFSSNQSTATASSPSCTAQHFATAAALAVATSSIPHTLQQQYHNFSSASMTDGGDMDEGIFDFDL